MTPPASLSPPVGVLRSFRLDWQTNPVILFNPSPVRLLTRSEYKALQRPSPGLCIQSLMSKNAIEMVENVKSLGFYSRLFLVPSLTYGGGQS